jgi:regulatory protein
VREVRDRLSRAGFSDEIIESVIEEAVERGWLDDAAFAVLWVRDRLLTKPKGRALLRRELRVKGVPEEHIDRALAEVEVDEEALIAQVIEQYMPRYRRLDPKTRERRLYALLMRRGFSPGAIRRALKSAEP